MMAIEAKRSTEAALAASKASSDGNKVTQDFGEMQVRAYLSAYDFKYRKEAVFPKGFFIDFKLENTGSSPAFNIAVECLGFSGDYQTDKVPTDKNFVRQFPLAAVWPPKLIDTVSFPVFHSDSISPDLIATKEDRIVVVEALVHYQTVFDRARKDVSGELSFRVKLPKTVAVGTFTAHKDGAFRSKWVSAVLNRVRKDKTTAFKIAEQYIGD